MKSIITIFGILIFSISFAQSNVEIETIKDVETIKLLNQIELLKEFKTENISIRIYQIGNETGSAGFNNGEITHNVYFAVSEFDEQPNQSLFQIKNLYAVEIVKIESKNSECSLIELTYTENKNKIKLRLELTISELKKASW